tara:strand:+ start:136 stop:540 length:405 start_codon:yes stop_codon:yes gene_type:complete
MNELTEKEWNLQVAESKGMSVDDYINPTEKQVNSKLESNKDAVSRKQTPVFSGVLQYFPDAIRAVARCSFVGNEQHNPDKPLHWDRAKSGDELDALTRHLLDAGTLDTDGVRHSTKVAWRGLANLQKEIENERK